MPVTSPPAYATQAPVAPRVQPMDSILVAQRRRGQEPARMPAVPEAEAVSPAPRAAPAVPAVAHALTPRLPGFVPTVYAHQGIPAVGEKQERSDLARLMRRITLNEEKLTPEQKADKIVDWLVTNDFMARNPKSDRASQKPSKFYNHDTATSKLFDGHGVSMATNMPWLKKEHVAAIRTILIDRAHASKADPSACSLPVQACLVRYFQLLKSKTAFKAISDVRAPNGGQPLRQLSALHIDDVYYDATRIVGGGGMGKFYVGISMRGYAVGVKRVEKRGAMEAKAMRSLSIGGYLQAHHGKVPDADSLIVMPCHSGTLKDFAHHFLRVPNRPRRDGSGGLIGARYMFNRLFLELAHLDEEMHGVHADIKDVNIFVSAKQSRFILGDFGISGKMSAQRDIKNTGFMTTGQGSPEQENSNSRLTAATDVFSLCVTAANALLQHDPWVAAAWTDLFPRTPLPLSLFPSDPRQLGEAFAGWFRYNEGSGVQPQNDLANGTYQESAPEPGRAYEETYKKLDAVMYELDESLWNRLRSGMRKRPERRPSARVLYSRIAIDNADALLCEQVWTSIPPYNSVIGAEIKRLKTMLAI